MQGRGSSHFGWVVVGSSFIILALSAGVQYSFSVFFVALIKEFGWSRSVAAGALSFFLILYTIIGPFLGGMVDSYGPRRVFILGSLFLGVGLLLCGLLQTWWQFYVFFGILTAIGTGSIGWVPNSTLIQYWFKEKRGLAMGIVSSGVGIGILICVPFIQLLINRVGWRMTYRMMAIFIPLIVISIAIAFFKRTPQASSYLTETGISHQKMKDLFVIDQAWVSRSWTVRQASTTRQFWLLSISFFFATFTTQSILAHHVAFFVDQGLEAMFGSYIVGVIGVVSVVGKILWGELSDRIGREVTYTIGIGCIICGIILLMAFTIFSSIYIPYAYAVFFGMGYAVTASLPPLITADFFEGKKYGSIFGTLFFLCGVGGAFGVWFTGFIYDLVKSYIPVFIIMMACVLLACFNIWKAAPRKIRMVSGKRHRINLKIE